MQLTHIVAGLLAALPIASAFYEEFCVTELGSHRVQRVSTTTVTSTIDFDLHETFYTKITSTTTPVVSVTTTETDTTSTTASTITDVFSTTVTSTLTETDTTTVTDSASTTTTATTTTTPVLTIAAGPSFTPILSEAEVIPFERRRHRRQSQGRYDYREIEERSIKAAQPFGRNVDGSKQCPVQYPQSVQCFKIVENIIFESTTITRTKTATASTSTNTITDTTTTTSIIIPPDVSTTITATTSTTTTTTETDTTTTTSTETDSTTVAAPTSTSYAQCQSDNIASLIGTESIISVYGFSSFSTLSDINSAEACCGACAILGNACSNFAYYSGTCYVINGPATCSANNAYTSYSQIEAGGGAVLYVIGNGACGLTDISQA